MFKLGFCIYGPKCRYRHTKQPGDWLHNISAAAKQSCAVTVVVLSHRQSSSRQQQDVAQQHSGMDSADIFQVLLSSLMVSYSCGPT